MTDTLDRLTAGLADRYTIDRELGRGGRAVVYLGRDLKHERQVALEVRGRRKARTSVRERPAGVSRARLVRRRHLLAGSALNAGDW